MEYRIESIIKTLRRLPPPTRVGEVRSIPVLMATWERAVPHTADQCTDSMPVMTVRAEVYGKGDNRWLEWMIDV